MAYEFLGVAFDVAGDMARSRKYVQKAFDLIDRVSDHERDIIASAYYATFGQLDKAIDAQQLGARTYPRSWVPHNALSGIYIDTGRYEEGLKEGLEASRLQPDAEPSYRRQLDAYICLNRLAEAKRLAGKLRAQGLGRSRIHQRFLEIAYIEEDQAAANVEIQWFAGKPEEYLSPPYRRPTGMSMAGVVSRISCTGELLRQRCVRGFEMQPRNSTKPMRRPTRFRAIA